jgi:sulfite exporter TauE/SafE
MTPWILFTIFVFGPCEVLIPMVMVPAANHSVWGVVAVTLAFGVATLATMLGIVVGAYLGLAKFTFPRLERFSHALAGSAILTCGVLVQFGGL